VIYSMNRPMRRRGTVPMLMNRLEYRDKLPNTSRLHRAISVIAASEKEELTNNLNRDIRKVRTKIVPRPFATWYAGKE